MSADEQATVPEQPSMTQQAAGGAIWSGVGMLATKTTGFAAQIALAWLLKPDDYARAGVVMMAASFAALIRDAGLSHVLLQRHRHFDRWANPAFWMSIVMGSFAGILLVTAIPIISRLYRTPDLGPLMIMIAISTVAFGVALVPVARVRASMRFNFLSFTATCTSIASSVLTVLLALLHQGAASLVAPVMIMAIVQIIIFWKPGRFRVRLDPQFRRWRFLLGDTGWSFAVSVLLCLISQGDYMILGLRVSRAQLGYYFFGFSLASQINVLSIALSQVLQPTFTRLNENPTQQCRALIRAACAIALPTSLFWFMQAALAGPLLRIAFGAKWVESIAVIQFLSIGYAVWNVAALSMSLMLADGRFRQLALALMVYVAVFLSSVWIGTSGQARGVSAAVALVFITMGSCIFRLSISSGSLGWRDIAPALLGPQLAGVFAVGCPLLLCMLLPDSPHVDWIRIAVISIVSVAIYVPLMRWTMTRTWFELKELAGGFSRRIFARLSPAAGKS